MRLHLFDILSVLLLPFVFAATTVNAQELEGSVWLNDTLPASYATIYCPSTGMGTTTDVDGRYLFTDLPRGEVVLEYAHLGYATQRVKVTLPEANHRYAHDVRLSEQPIRLDGVFVTPDGQDPVSYIMERVTRQQEANAQRLKAYEAKTYLDFDAANLDIFNSIMPWAIRVLIKTGMKAAGVGAVYDMCAKNPYVDVRLTAAQTLQQKKVQNSQPTLVKSNIDVNDKALQQLHKSVTDPLYDLPYSEDFGLDLKKWKKKGFKLIGTIEENGLDVDVLKSGTYTVYVVEDLWTVLRIESSDESEYTRLECRDVGGGIYMPISFIVSFTLPDLLEGSPEAKQMTDSIARLSDKEFQQMMDHVLSEANDSIPRRAQPLLRRMFTSMREHRKFQLSMAMRYSISYSNVKVEP